MSATIHDLQTLAATPSGFGLKYPFASSGREISIPGDSWYARSDFLAARKALGDLVVFEQTFDHLILGTVSDGPVPAGIVFEKQLTRRREVLPLAAFTGGAALPLAALQALMWTYHMDRTDSAKPYRGPLRTISFLLAGERRDTLVRLRESREANELRLFATTADPKNESVGPGEYFAWFGEH